MTIVPTWLRERPPAAPKPQGETEPRKTVERLRLRWGPRLVWTNPNPKKLPNQGEEKAKR